MGLGLALGYELILVCMGVGFGGEMPACILTVSQQTPAAAAVITGTAVL
jgi:hypothetical protein